MAQVPKEHYEKNYDDLNRFISYFYQIDLVKRLNVKTILEIGIGNKTVSNYLKHSGFNVTTCDFDKSLKPDYVADIRKLPLKDNSYDLVMACEILEHLPWEEADAALKEMQRVTKMYAVISLPYPGITFEAALKFPLLRRFSRKSLFNLFIRIPLFFKTIKFNGEHYWEIGVKNYPISKVRKLIKKRFRILKEVRPVLNPYNHFFLIEKRL